MENNSKNGEAGRGPDAPKKTPSLAEIEKFMENDLKSCGMFIEGLLRDPDLRRMMAQWLKGRIENHNNKPDPRQVALFQQKELIPND